MKILVTGASGFVGSHLCDYFSGLGHEVYALARNKKKFEQFKVPGIFIQGELSSDSAHPWVKELPTDLDVVIHTAGIVHSFNAGDFYKVNTDSSIQLIKDLSEHNQKLRFIYISSLAAMGPGGENAIGPVSQYGRSKLKVEQYLKANCPSDWDFTIIRPPMIIGPRDPAVLDIFKMVQSGIILSPGLNPAHKWYSFLCIHDLVDLIVKCTMAPKLPKAVLSPCHDQVITMKQLVETIKVGLGKKSVLFIPIPGFIIRLIGIITGFISHMVEPKIRITNDKANEIIPNNWTCSNESTKELGMEYHWNLDKTVNATIADYKSRGWLKS